MKAGRRKFLAAVAASTVSCGGRKSPWRFFTSEEARTVQALCECIIPADQDPGAGWAGVARFLDLQLVGFHKALQKTYRDGLAAVDRASREKFGARFAQLNADNQTALLLQLEKQRAPFFDLLVSHTMQGFYGSPRHGGNREAVSWKMLGVPYPPIRGQA